MLPFFQMDSVFYRLHRQYPLKYIQKFNQYIRNINYIICEIKSLKQTLRLDNFKLKQQKFVRIKTQLLL